MRTPDGRAFAGTDPLKAANRQRDKNIDVLNRRWVKQPKIPPPAVSGGGPVGIAHVRAAPATILSSGGYGTPRIRWDGLDYSLNDSYASEGIPASQWCTPDMGHIGLTAGWYDVTVSVNLGWADPTGPTAVQPLIYAASAGMPFDTHELLPPASIAGRRGIRRHLHYGPMMLARNGNASFELLLPGATFTGDFLPTNGLSGGDPMVWWTITKLA